MPLKPDKKLTIMKSDNYRSFSSLTILLLFGLLFTVSLSVSAADIQLPGIGIDLDGAEGETGEVATAIKIVLGLTVLSLAPAIMIVMTSFTRIIVVLAILRHAFGMQQTPPQYCTDQPGTVSYFV